MMIFSRRRTGRIFSAAAVALAAMTAMPFKATASEVREDRGNFAVFLGGVRIGVLGFSGLTDGQSYAAKGILRTTGLAALVRQVGYEATSRGVVRAGRFVPTSYDESANTGTRVSKSTMEYRGGVPQVKASSPERAPRPTDVDPRTQAGTVDPMTAFYLVLRDVPEAELCNLDLKMFDGTRRSQVVISAPVRNGTGVSCSGEYRRLQGFSAEEMAERTRFPFQIAYVPNGNGGYRLNEITTASTFGNARVVRTD